MSTNSDLIKKAGITYKNFVPECKPRNRFADSLSNDAPVTKELLGNKIRNFYLETVATNPECEDQNSLNSFSQVPKPTSVTNFNNFDPQTSIQETNVPNTPTNHLKSTQYAERISIHTIFKYAEKGKLSRLKTALQSGMFNVNVRDNFSWTLLMSSSYNGQEEVTLFLLSMKIDVEARNRRGQTAYDLALLSSNHKIAELIRNSAIAKNNSLSRDYNYGSSSNHTLTIPSSINQKKWCNVCNKELSLSYASKIQDDHAYSTTHLFNVQDKIKLQTSYAIPSSSIGYKLMLKSGWKTNKGLGKHGNGRKYPIKTALKNDRKGIGASKRPTVKVTHFKAFDTNILDKPCNKFINMKIRTQELKEERAWEKAMIRQLKS
ncbi:G patch domain and ankyrin repeat-containing protein 1 [Trichoplax sp. H2]|nr:G patch domain and ankyrin repeat-containing protein 1 [Trichoplax sp. H2]|eukprot:RDD40015.1 G patch domain and ankyrin repeat-containing protein 1 [Trichoplax sp. H2]